MKKSIKNDFENLDEVESILISKNQNLVRNASLYAFLRPLLFKNISGKNEHAAINLNSIVFQFIFLPITFFKVFLRLFFYKNTGLVFCNERKNEQGKWRYISTLPSLENSQNIVLRYSFNHFPKVFERAIDIAPFIIFLKFFSRFGFLKRSPREFLTELSEIYKKKYNLNLISLLEKKSLEFFFLESFFKILLFVFSPKRVIFVSNNFFIPLITISKEKEIPSYEIAHALMNKYHPSYSYNYFIKKPFYPDFLIESKLAFNFDSRPFSYKKIIFTEGRKKINKDINKLKAEYRTPRKMLYSDLFNLNNKKILVIGQGGPTDELLLKKIYPHLGSNKNKITFREHPSSKGKINKDIFFVSKKSLEDDLKDNDIIISNFSHVIMLACLYNKDIYAIDDYWYDALDSMKISYNKLNND